MFTGIPPHVDTHSAFEDTILSLSLGATVRSQCIVLWFETFLHFNIRQWCKVIKGLSMDIHSFACIPCGVWSTMIISTVTSLTTILLLSRGTQGSEMCVCSKPYVWIVCPCDFTENRLSPCLQHLLLSHAHCGFRLVDNVLNDSQTSVPGCRTFFWIIHEEQRNRFYKRLVLLCPWLL